MSRFAIDPPDEDRWESTPRPCLTPHCDEDAASDADFCNVCLVVSEELAALRRKEANEAIYLRAVRSGRWGCPSAPGSPEGAK